MIVTMTIKNNFNSQRSTMYKITLFRWIKYLHFLNKYQKYSDRQNVSLPN